MIALLTTSNAIKLGALRALLEAEALTTWTFDDAAGALWGAAIPLRLMVREEDVHRACSVLRLAGYVQAGDGDWDLGPSA